jgi:polyisoprenyl-teichoic acid--peptidoglycan teichoic acid transferase
MSDNYTNSADTTQPFPPPSPADASSPQKKLVLGSFHNPSPIPNPPQSAGQLAYRGQGVYSPPDQSGRGRLNNRSGQTHPQNTNQTVYSGVHGVPGRLPYQQTRSGPPSQASTNALPYKKRRNRGCLIGCGIPSVLILIVIIMSILTIPRVLAFGSAISTQPPLVMSGDMSTNKRTNMLIMGYGGTGHDGAYLTDSLLVVSLLPQSHHTSLVSVPRDLWVQNPYTTASNVNAIYTVASNTNQNPAAGGKATAEEVAKITGLNIKYWMTINFAGFRDLIDSIGGVDIYVPDSFSANYPQNDDPEVDASWKVITFTKGNMHMDGETAMEYSRARYVIDNKAEASDFARSARQQIIVKAVLAKMKQISSWPHLFSALDALQHTIYTNMSLADLVQFGFAMDLNSQQTAHIGLSVENVLDFETSDDGQSILVPQNDDWSAVATYVQQHLYN